MFNARLPAKSLSRRHGVIVHAVVRLAAPTPVEIRLRLAATRTRWGGAVPSIVPSLLRPAATTEYGVHECVSSWRVRVVCKFAEVTLCSQKVNAVFHTFAEVVCSSCLPLLATNALRDPVD